MLGCAGVFLPLTGMVAFHFLVLRCWRLAFVLSWIFGVFVDLSYCRVFPYYLVVLPLVLFLARFWRGYHLTYVYFVQFVPGMAIGFFSGLAAVIVQCLNYDGIVSLPVMHMIWVICKCMMLSGICMPIVIWLLDKCSGLLGLMRYTRVGGEYLLGARSEIMEDESDVLP